MLPTCTHHVGRERKDNPSNVLCCRREEVDFRVREGSDAWRLGDCLHDAECVSSEFETSKTKTRWNATLTLGGEVGDDMVSVELLASMPADGNRIPNSLGKIKWMC
jgi:hypothetical protein